MLTSISWVPKGGMKPVPLLSTDSEEKVQMKLKTFQTQLAGLGGNSNSNSNDDDAEKGNVHALHGEQQNSKSKDMISNQTGEDEDEEDEEEEASALLRNDNINSTLRDIAGGGNDAVLEQIESENDDDDNDNDMQDEDGRKEEKDDVRFKDTDLVFAVSVADSHQPRVELYTYDEPQDVLFVHHDMEVAAFPLCTEWLTDGNMSLLAVGTMLPLIEIWALDVMDSVEPAITLGGCTSLEMNYLPRDGTAGSIHGNSKTQKSSKLKNKKMMKRHLKPHSHTEGVLTLKWNTVVQHLICSGSADHTIKLWDLNAHDTCVSTFNDGEKIQSLDWHRDEPHLLLSGGYNKQAIIRDCRIASQSENNSNKDETMQTNSNGVIRVGLNDVVEHVEFVPSSPLFMASTSSGQWACMDSRMCTSSSSSSNVNNSRNILWSFAPHGQGEVTFNCSRQVSGLFATGGKDGKISLWDGRQMQLQTSQEQEQQQHNASHDINTSNSSNQLQCLPKEIVTRDYKTGIVLGLQFHPNSPHILGAAGARGEPLVYTMTSDLINVFKES